MRWWGQGPLRLVACVVGPPGTYGLLWYFGRYIDCGCTNNPDWFNTYALRPFIAAIIAVVGAVVLVIVVWLLRLAYEAVSEWIEKGFEQDKKVAEQQAKALEQDGQMSTPAGTGGELSHADRKGHTS